MWNRELGGERAMVDEEVDMIQANARAIRPLH